MSKDLVIRIAEDDGAYKVFVNDEKVFECLLGEEDIIGEMTVTQIQELALKRLNYLLHC